MKRYLAFILLTCLIFSLMITGCAGIQPAPQQLPTSEAEIKDQPPKAEATSKDALDSPVILGFYTDAGKSSRDSLLNNIKTMNEVAFFWYSFDGAGKLNREKNVDLSLKAAAQKNGTKVYALVHNLRDNQFDPKLTHQVLGNPSLRAKLINNLVRLAAEENWDGITIDIEKTFPADRNNYSVFLRQLHTALKAKNKGLTVTIPAKYHDDPNDLWSGGYDYAAIGKEADQVVLMTYEEHGLGTTQGPIASYGWVKRVIDFAVTKIPRKKIIMGIPVYAYDWVSNKPMLPVSISLSKAVSLAQEHSAKILYDENQQAPHYAFTVAGVRHEVYFENNRSLKAKLDLIKKDQVRGIAIWRLGLEEPKMWPEIFNNYAAGH